MYKILIVDDEPYIVSGLYDLCTDLKEYELDIFCAYSADEALERLRTTTMDIVITDIQMPGMSGLELMKIIKSWWPRTKMIFLTGYGSFDYIQTAMRSEAVDFLLKTEGDDRIVEAIRKAIRSCKEDMEWSRLITDAKERLGLARPVLQKEFLLQLLQGEPCKPDVMAHKFTELEVPLHAESPCLLIVGRVDEWREDYHTSDKSLMVYAIQNIAEEYVSPAMSFQSVIHNAGEFYWLMQPKALASQEENESEAWRRALLFVHGTMDAIQSTCKSLLKLPISLAAGSSPVAWEQLPYKYRELTRLLSRGLGLGGEMLMLENEDHSGMVGADVEEEEGGRQQTLSPLDRTEMLEKLMESGRQDEFKELVDETFSHIPITSADLFKEAYYAVAIRLFAYMNRWKVQRTVRFPMNIDQLLQYDRHASATDAVHYLLDVAAVLFEHRMSDQEERTNDLVRQLHRYIEEQLSSDVSLTRLGDVFSLNPSYLCRLYKQMTGNLLSDYIADAKMNKAKELLVQSRLKMHEIGKAIGFESPAYFSRFFKKYTRITPQEYRDRYQSNPTPNS